MPDFQKDKKYILHKGQPFEEVVTFGGYIGDKILVFTLTGYSKTVGDDELTEIPENKLTKALKYIVATLIPIATKELLQGLFKNKRKAI